MQASSQETSEKSGRSGRLPVRSGWASYVPQGPASSFSEQEPMQRAGVFYSGEGPKKRKFYPGRGVEMDRMAAEESDFLQDKGGH